MRIGINHVASQHNHPVIARKSINLSPAQLIKTKRRWRSFPHYLVSSKSKRLQSGKSRSFSLLVETATNANTKTPVKDDWSIYYSM
jgi:hypothetical protein